MRLKNLLLNKLFSEQKTDLRLYARFPLVHDRVGFVTIGGHPLGRIRELSYGGFSLEPEAGTLDLLKGGPDEKQITLHLLDGRLECRAVRRFENERFIGFAFVHETLKTYEFLHQYLPFMKFGAALRFLVHREETSARRLPQFLAQDENIRASFDIDGYDDSKAPLATIEMMENGFFYKLVRSTGGVQTWHSIGLGGKGGTLRPTPTLDNFILRKAICFLLGYAAADYEIPIGKLALSLIDFAEAETFFPTHPRASLTKPAGKVVPFKRNTATTAPKRKTKKAAKRR